uniref:uncharacterized protein LOC118147859 n=1 Tax=Callithrix jacchus TaxID=9483 RepID=UPI0004F05DAD|nr:uncharacterized protein LOC118147859 [Callithrix jacchus]
MRSYSAALQRFPVASSASLRRLWTFSLTERGSLSSLLFSRYRRPIMMRSATAGGFCVIACSAGQKRPGTRSAERKACLGYPVLAEDPARGLGLRWAQLSGRPSTRSGPAAFCTAIWDAHA